jgi:CopG family transcriptional regulator, nickel-responsive regulator
MQRFTISLDSQLAIQFDQLIEHRGYVNRSEAVRDLIRAQLGTDSLQLPQNSTQWCVATVSFVYDHHEATTAQRVMALQHDHHDLVVTSSHIHLDHSHCLETVVLRGPLTAVQQFADQLVALRGARHGNIHRVLLHHSSPVHSHTHSHAHSETSALAPHSHLKPLS